MFKSLLIDAWPLAALLALVTGALVVLVKLVRIERRPGGLAELHADEAGSVQSLSFVLTVPVFIMLMLLAVQITQIMIGLMVVHYAAFAAIRSATVWIPACLEPGPEVGENRIGQRIFERLHHDGVEYRIEPGTIKYEKIRSAAALACVPIAPSRDLGLASADATTGAIQSVYTAMAPTSTNNPRVAQRLANKWAYSNAATTIAIKVHHRNDEPLLLQYGSLPESEFTPYEIGWRDQIQVTVTHQFALLPGPGRLLARNAGGGDQVSSRIRQQTGVYFIPLTATATMVGEGEKSVRPYVQSLPTP